MVDSRIAFGDQPVTPGERLEDYQSNLAKLTLITGGITASGFISTKTGRIWDKYLSTTRAIEAGSPGGVLRTFRVSEFLSPLESWSAISASAADIRAGAYGKHLKAMFGQAKSYSLTKTGAIFGEVRDGTGKLIGMGLNIEAGSQKGVGIADFYARAEGVQLGQHESLNDAILRNKWQQSKSVLPYSEWLDRQAPEIQRQRLIIGARLREKVRILGRDIKLSEGLAKNLVKAETLGKLLSAKAASTASRLNILLRSPLELPGISKIAEKIPGMSKLGVKPGTATQLLGRYVGKAMLLGAAWKGLEYADYLQSEGSPWSAALNTAGGATIGSMISRKPGMKFGKVGLIAGAALGLAASVSPRFENGLFAGVASIYTDLNIARAKASEALGFTQTLQEQEELTPGLISYKTALGFGGVGAMIAGLGSYSAFAGVSIAQSISTKTPMAHAFDNVRKVGAPAAMEKMWSSKLGSKIAKIPLLGQMSKIKSPVGLGFAAGIAAYGLTALTLSALSGRPGALLAGIFGTTDTPEELEAMYSGEEEVAVRKGRWWEFGKSTPYEGGKIEYYRPHAIARLNTRAYQKGLYGDESEKWDYDPLLHPFKALFGSDDWKYHYEQKYQYERPAPMTGTYGEEIPFIGPIVAATFGKIFKPRKEIRSEEWKRGEGGYLYQTDARGETTASRIIGGAYAGAPVAPDDPSQLFNELNYRRREAVGLMGFTEASIMKAIFGREETFQNKQTMATMGKETGAESWLWDHLNVGGGMGTSEIVRRFIPRTRSYLDTYNPLTNTMPSWMPDKYFLDLKHGNPFDKIKEAEIRLPGSGYAALHPEVKGIDPEKYPIAHKLKILGDVAMWSKEYRAMLKKAKEQMHTMSAAEIKIITDTEQQVKEKKQRKNFHNYVFAEEQLSKQKITVSEVLAPGKIRAEEYGNIIINLAGIGDVKDTEAALAFTRETMLGKEVNIQTAALESRRYTDTAAGPTMKGVAMVDGQDYGSLLAEKDLATGGKLQDEFKQLKLSKLDRLVGGLSEKILHGMETPLEYLTPFSPASKLIRQRSAIEDYVATEAVGTSASFWDKPIENFLRPAWNMMKRAFGSEEIPEEIQQRRNIQEYFDMLKWTKASRIESKATIEGDTRTAAKYRQQRQSTVFGVDTFKSPVSIMRALPRRSRDFFKDFRDAKSQQDRNEILKLIPENEKRLYRSQWMQQNSKAAQVKVDAKMATENDNRIIADSAKYRQSEGFDYSPDMRHQWEKETGGNVEFDDWMREQKAGEYFETHSLPGADWLGWHPSVDLEDVKLQYVENAGFDFHDFDLWGKRKKGLAYKPYIDDDLIEEMKAEETYESPDQVARKSRAFGKMFSEYQTEITQSQIDAGLAGDKYTIEVVDGREKLVEDTFKFMGAR